MPTSAVTLTSVELEALKHAVRWPFPSQPTIVTLVGQFLAAHRDQDAFAYFADLRRQHPHQALFLALDGLFQARVAATSPLFRRPGQVRTALRKLDAAVEREPGLTTYFRGLVQVDLPALFRRREQAIRDLEWVLAHRDQFPVGLRRGTHFGLAKAYAAAGNANASAAALRRSGASSLHARETVLMTVRPSPTHRSTGSFSRTRTGTISAGLVRCGATTRR